MIKKSLIITGHIVSYLFIFLVACFLFIFIQGKMNPHKVPTLFGYSYLHVLTGSMEPVIHKDDLILIKSVDTTEIKKEDIITFYSHNGNYTVTHRVVDITKDQSEISFKTKGDNNNTPDTSMVSSRQVVGKYLFRVPFGGLFMTFISSIYGWISISFFILLVFMINKLREKDYIRQ